MTAIKMPPDKSQLLAYLKHTPGFEQIVWEFADLTTSEIMSRVKEQDNDTYKTCVEIFQERGVPLPAA